MINPGSDLISVACSTTGTGSTLAIGAASENAFTPAQAGLADSAAVTYVLLDGADTELGTATYSSAEPQLESRTPVLSSNSNAAISLSGSATLYITASVSDLIGLNTQVRSIRTISGTADTPTAADAGRYLRCTSASAVTITIDDSVFSAGDVVTIRQAGAGLVSLAAGTGVTLNGDTDAGGQHTNLQIVAVSASIFDVIGGVA